jgi:NAD:arginine ADP-ribosyltransferase
MDIVEQYVINNLIVELYEVQFKTLHAPVNLTIYEKTLIYKYSNDGYKDVNQILLRSKGQQFGDFGTLLYTTISKLPDYRGIVYRKVFLTPAQLQRYIDAYTKRIPVKEYPFISTSKFTSVAILWSGLASVAPNCLFVIYTKTGKEIELMSKFVEEKEVLLKPNTQFNVLNIYREPDYIQISMEEL